MAQNKIEEMALEGATAEQIANYLRDDLEPTAPAKKKASDIFASMNEQDVSMSAERSPIRDLTLAYNKGVISDEQYAEIHSLLGL